MEHKRESLQKSSEMHVVSEIRIMDKLKTNELGHKTPLHKALCHDCEMRMIVE